MNPLTVPRHHALNPWPMKKLEILLPILMLQIDRFI